MGMIVSVNKQEKRAESNEAAKAWFLGGFRFETPCDLDFCRVKKVWTQKSSLSGAQHKKVLFYLQDTENPFENLWDKLWQTDGAIIFFLIKGTASRVGKYVRSKLGRKMWHDF